jgi:hypothetical protein
MQPPTVIDSHGARRVGKPRVYTLPIVRPAPPRPGGDPVRTW